MVNIALPISKSIAARVMMLQAIHGDPLMRVSRDMPDDVLILHRALEQLSRHKAGEKLELQLGNCGTALRFLQVHLERCYQGEPITLKGDERLMERDGKPTSQTISARILHGDDIAATADESPYITMSRYIRDNYTAAAPHSPFSIFNFPFAESCWSSAAFWYEYAALHGGQYLLLGLKDESLQGDRRVADIYAEHFGVSTSFTEEGAVITSSLSFSHISPLYLDFDKIPDLYPAIALTAERLGIELRATGTERLRYKESDRMEAVRLHEVRGDHRMAMSLMAADYAVTVEEQECIKKSYPGFAVEHITPRRGINDEGRGKKYALGKLMREVCAEYIWMHDDDVLLPEATRRIPIEVLSSEADLIILPLMMQSERERPTLLEQVQIAEYAAIQELTMSSAKSGKAVMCSGANMIVRREAWLECEEDLHREIPSGDDMFLLEAMKRRGKRIVAIDRADYTAVVHPQTTWRGLWRQRMRWAGKAPKYTDRDIVRCGVWVVVLNVLQVVCPLVLLVKFPLEYSMIKKRNATSPWAVALLLEIAYPFYMLVSLIGGLIHKGRW